MTPLPYAGETASHPRKNTNPYHANSATPGRGPLVSDARRLIAAHIFQPHSETSNHRGKAWMNLRFPGHSPSARLTKDLPTRKDMNGHLAYSGAGKEADIPL